MASLTAVVRAVPNDDLPTQTHSSIGGVVETDALALAAVAKMIDWFPIASLAKCAGGQKNTSQVCPRPVLRPLFPRRVTGQVNQGSMLISR